MLNKSPGFILTQFGLTKDNVEEKVKATDDQTLVDRDRQGGRADLLPHYCLTAGSPPSSTRKSSRPNEKDGDFGNDWLKTEFGRLRRLPAARLARQRAVYARSQSEQYKGGAPKTKRVVVRHVAEPAASACCWRRATSTIARNLSKDQLDGLPVQREHRDRQGRQGLQSSISASTRRTRSSPSPRCARR